LRGAKDFCSNFPKLAQNVDVQLFTDRLRGVTSKKWPSLAFLRILGAIFPSQTTLGAIFTDFA